MNGVLHGSLGGFAGLLDLLEKVGVRHHVPGICLLKKLGCVASEFAHQKQRDFRLHQQQIDVFIGQLLQFFLNGSGLVVVDGDHGFEKIDGRFHHDHVEELFLAAKVVVQQGQVDAGFFGDVACACGGKSFFVKDGPRRLFDLRLGGRIGLYLLPFGGRLHGAKENKVLELNKCINHLIKPASSKGYSKPMIRDFEMKLGDGIFRRGIRSFPTFIDKIQFAKI